MFALAAGSSHTIDRIVRNAGPRPAGHEEDTMRRAFAALALLSTLALIGGLTGAATAQGTPAPVEDVPANLMPPAGAVLLFELGARGVQIYACEAKPDDATAFAWAFQAPEADLFNGRGEAVGSHFAGPTWRG